MQPSAWRKFYVGFKRHCPVKSGQRFLIFPQVKKHIGAAEPCFREIGIECQRSTVCSQRIVVLLQMQKDIAATDASLGKVGIERKRTVIGSKRTLSIPQDTEGKTADKPGLG